MGDMIPADPGPFMSMQRHSTALNGIIFKPSQESQLRSARGGFHVDSKPVIISISFGHDLILWGIVVQRHLTSLKMFKI